MKKWIALTVLLVFVVMVAVWPLATNRRHQYVERVGTGTGWSWTLPILTTGTGLEYKAVAMTSGDILKLIADDDNLVAGGSYISCLGGTAQTTEVWKVGEGGIMTLKGGATLDNDTSATVLNLTETTVRVTGAFDVTGGLTTDTNAFAIADTTGVLTLKNGATIDNNASATVLNLTETTVRATGILDVTGNSTLASLDVGGGSGGSGATITTAGAGTFDGALAANAGITVDTSAFAVADTTGVVTLIGGATIDNNADNAILNLTETTVRATGILDVTGNSTLASADIGGGYGTTGATISAAGVGQFNGALTTDGALTADSAAIGGGYGATGVSISNVGAISANGALTVDGTSTLTGQVTVGAGANAIKSPAGGADAAGTALTVTAGAGGAASAGGQVGGASSLVGGAGSVGVGAVTSGDGGAISITGGAGAQASGATGTGGDGGDVNIAAGAAGAANGGAAGTVGSVKISGGYGATGVSITDAGNIQANGTLTVDSTSALTGQVTVGGGYGDTGATLSGAGVGQFNGALTTDGALTADNIVCTNAATFGGGYGATGATISTAGVGQYNGALTTDGALTADNIVCTNAATFGGGYGSTGATLSTAGVGQFNGALTTDGALTADSAAVGGGYGSTGTSLSNDGNIQANGTLTVDGTSTLTGALTAPVASVVADATTARTSTSADYGKTIIMSDASGSVAVTLPANGAAAGSWIRFIFTGEAGANITIASATVDTLITFNDTAADSVQFATTQRIGASVLCISNGSFWIAINQSQNTMTVNT